jgi:hypothetical protein
MYIPVTVEVQDSMMRQYEGDIFGRKIVRAAKLVKSIIPFVRVCITREKEVRRMELINKIIFSSKLRCRIP